MPATCRTLDLLRRGGPPRLLVSLPQNGVDLATAAVEAGAEGLKVHLNMRHAASGAGFGTLEEEAESIAAIGALGVPVGVVPGDDVATISPDEVARLAHLGVDYVDLYLRALPAWLLGNCPVGLMVAMDENDLAAPSRLASVATMPLIQMVEASFIPHAGYGLPLSAADLCGYTLVARKMARRGRPVVVPTQRKVTYKDIPALVGTGVAALLIGAIVTGTEPETIAAATRGFRKALSELG